MALFLYLLYGLVLEGREPDLVYDRVQCVDVGAEWGGSGKAAFKCIYEKRARGSRSEGGGLTNRSPICYNIDT